MKFTQFYNKFNSFLSSLIIEDFNTFDKEIKGLNSIDAVDKRIKFWERKKKDSKGKEKTIKECDKYIKYLKSRIEELKNPSPKEEKPYEIEVEVDINQK